MELPLEIADLKVTAPCGRVLLRVEKFHVAPGAAVGLCGPSGAGKSTFLHAIAGLLDRISGRVVWGQTDIAGLRAAARARFRAAHVGMIFQDAGLFEELDALSNAALAALFAPAETRRAIQRRAEDELARLGLGAPGRRVSSFSGGERQRVGIARALAGNAPVLLADEPTANLHRAAADQLTDDFLALARERRRTLLVVSHDETLLGRLDRVVEIRDGVLGPDTAAARAVPA